MISRTSLWSALLAYLLHATAVSAVTIKIPIPVIIVGPAVHSAAFSFLIFFAILTGFLFVVALGRVLGSKEELPPDVSPSKYETGLLFHWLSFFAVTLWWAWLIVYIVYVRDALMRKTGFPVSGYVALYALDQFTDVLVAASALLLVHYRRTIYNSTMPPSSPLKKAFDVCLLIAQIGVIGYTTALLSISATNVSSDPKYVNWLTSWYVYTLAYGLVVIDVVVTMFLFKRSLKKNSIVDEPCSHATAVPGSLIVHLLFKIIMNILYSQWNTSKIDYDILRVFEAIVLGLTYFIAMLGLVLAPGRNTEDDKKMKAIKELEKQQKAAMVMHSHKLASQNDQATVPH